MATSVIAGSDATCKMRNSAMHSDKTFGPGGEQIGGISSNRSPRQGLGAADLARNEQRLRNPDGYAATDTFFQPDMQEPAGADRFHQHYDSETLSPIGATDADRNGSGSVRHYDSN